MNRIKKMEYLKVNLTSVGNLILYLIAYNFLAIIIILLMYKWSCKFNFWKKRNVKGPKPSFIFGNLKDNIFGRKHMSELTKNFYDDFQEEKMIGIFVHQKPTLILRDRNLIKDVLVKDFSVFSDRGIKVYNKIEPLAQHFFNLPEETWRPIREKVSAAFTTTKIKHKFEQIYQYAENFTEFIESESKNSECLETAGTIGTLINQVIGNFGFNLKIDPFSKEADNLKKITSRRSECSKFNFTRRFLRNYFPLLYKYSKFFIKNPEMNNFFINFVKDIIDYRSKRSIILNDYIGRLMQTKINDLGAKEFFFNVIICL